jgi:hypothetical protein
MEDVYQRYSRNGGNGCDGPAIEHAVAISAGRSRPGLVTREEARTARYSKNVPVFWVCDGQLTDSTDGAVRGELLRSVARFVVRNKVRVAPNVETAVAMLTGRLSTYSVAWGRLGSVIPKHKGGQA